MTMTTTSPSLCRDCGAPIIQLVKRGPPIHRCSRCEKPRTSYNRIRQRKWRAERAQKEGTEL